MHTSLPDQEIQTISDTPARWSRDDLTAQLAAFRRVAVDRPDLKQA
jgi:hypothetical protein